MLWLLALVAVVAFAEFASEWVVLIVPVVIAVAMARKGAILYSRHGYSIGEVLVTMIGVVAAAVALGYPLAGILFAWMMGGRGGFSHIGLLFLVMWVVVATLLILVFLAAVERWKWLSRSDGGDRGGRNEDDPNTVGSPTVATDRPDTAVFERDRYWPRP